jgi:hypothetical protein
LPKANLFLVALGLAVVLLFAGGLFGLLTLRFDSGDIYPPYSSLRSDPLGTRALFDSLDRLPGLTVARHYTRPEKLPPEATTLILAGLEEHAFEGPEREIDALHRFVINGGRAVLMLTAVRPNCGADEKDPSDPCDEDHQTPTADDENEALPDQPHVISLRSKWGFQLETPTQSPDGREARRDPASSPELPAALVWHSGMVLVPGHPDWRVLYRIDDRPVVMERRLGRGSIFLGTDSYLVSNEALRNHRQPALLGRMVGSSRTVLFEETHFGIHHRPGISNLIRRYRLHGLIFGLMLLAGLYIWRNGRSFLPAPPQDPDEGFRLAYQDTDLALVSLIGRHLPDDQLLDTCVAAYEQALIRPGADMTAKLARIKKLAAQANGGPVKTYQSICQLLARRPSR